MKNLYNAMALIIALLYGAIQANAQVITLWNFNSVPPDNNTGTGTTDPAVGSGSLTLLGGTTATFASGFVNGGSGDTASSDNAAYNTTNYPAQGSGSGTAGVEFKVSTVGFSKIQIKWSHRHSNTSSQYVQLQYTTNGTTWQNYTGAGTDTAGLYRALSGDSWNFRSADFTGISGVENNANFAFRIVAVFNPNTGQYSASSPTGNYASGGTWRFDMVTVQVKPFKLQILHSGDMEAGVPATSNIPHFAAIVDTLEHAYPNSVTISSGDAFIPSPFLFAGADGALTTPLRSTVSSYFNGGGTGTLATASGRPDIACMNIIGFNVSVFGNHEFDLGTGDLNTIIGVDIRSASDRRWVGAQFPYLSANLDFSANTDLSYLVTNDLLPDTAFKTPANITANNQKKGIAPYTFFERDGEKIGVVGATTTILATISSPGTVKVKGPGAGLENMDSLAVILQPYIDTLVNVHKINKIILLSHLQQIKFEKELATKLKGIDIVIAGGNHGVMADGTDRLRPGDVKSESYPYFTQNKDNEPVVILNAASEWKYVGRFVGEFDGKGILNLNSLDSNINGLYAADSQMVADLYGSYARAFESGKKAELTKRICDSVLAVIVRKDGTPYGKTNVFLEGRRDFVRTEETNLGNLTADANLWQAKQYDNTVRVSIKNGGGVRSYIGDILAVGADLTLLPPQANPISGKQTGDVSQLDIENSLRFNNRLSLLTLTASGIKQILEHGIAVTAPGQTPGRFPQVGGIRFSFDETRTAGDKIRSAAIVDSAGNILDILVRDGAVQGDANRQIRIVTLNFLASGGDGYPFNTLGTNRVELDTALKNAGSALFSVPGSEQDAFAEYMLRFHTSASPFSQRDTTRQADTRIQQIRYRNDNVLPAKPGDFSLISPANNASVTVRSGDNTPINIIWGKSANANTYKWKAGLPGQAFLLDVPSNSNGTDTVLTLTSGTIDGILAGLGIREGDSVLLNWTVFAFNGSDSTKARETFNITLKRFRNAIVPAAFNLLTPANNARIQVRPGNTTPVVITWEASTGANRYNWLAGLPGTTLTPPLVQLPADNNGAQNRLTLTEAAIDNLLAGFGVQPGDSVSLAWTVHAYSSTGDSTRANQIFNITIRRRPVLSAFSLVSPIAETRVETQPGINTPVNITWRRATNAIRYRWKAIPLGTNPLTPILNILSNNNGADTVLTLTIGAIDAALEGAGVRRGDSITLEWFVWAYNRDNDSLRSREVFKIHLVRKIGVNVNNIAASSGIQVYPNPAIGILNISAESFSGDAVIELYDMRGALVRKATAQHGEGRLQYPLNIEGLAEGMYTVRISGAAGEATFKAVIK